MTHPHPKGNFVPKAILMKPGIKTLNTAGQNFSKAAISVNTAYQRPTVNNARTTSNIFNRVHSHVSRPFNKSTTNKNSNLNEKVNTVKGNVTTARPKAVVSDSKGYEANAVKASACWVWRPKQKVLDHVSRHNGQSTARHMTGNKSYLSDYEEIDGGFVAFGGDPKGGRITGKGKISTDIECVVLSPDFKSLDENHVLIRVPRKDNMYSVDLKNIVPLGGLTCLFANATLDESNLWHRRLGHINFKILNKLVRGNLVRGLPSKIFENNHTCVACQKGKQHKASCKTKTVMNQFYEMKGIKREFSVARTPKQNGVAERKNRTLIEAARTMLSDSKLPTTFWAEAVNTACYVQNRVLVIKSYNKTPYERFLDGKENITDQKYILLPLLTFNSSLSKSLKDSPNAEFKPSREEEKIDFEYQENEDSEVPNTEEPRRGEAIILNGVQKQKMIEVREQQELCCQPPVFEDPQFPDTVYKSRKKLYIVSSAPIAWELTFFLGLQVKQKDDGIFISQDKYVADILKKFDFATVKTASTLIETNKALLKDEEAEDVDVHLYRSMIGSLMYLTTSRPDITLLFVLVQDSSFDLEYFSDSDYAGASLDRKSTTGSCQFLGKILISWQCKKQTIVANSTTEAKYIAAANCCGQVGDEAVHKELGDKMERAATTASSFEAEQDSGSGSRCQETTLGM
ncbi:ribonuclease H-like domain-containing protein [Tanacetum coccineum]